MRREEWDLAWKRLADSYMGIFYLDDSTLQNEHEQVIAMAMKM